MWYSVCCAVKCDKDCQLIPPVYNVSFSHSYLYLTRLCSVNYILSRNKSSGYGPELKSLGRQACDPTTTVQVKLGLKGWGTSVTCLCFEPWCSEYQPCWCWLDSLLSSLYSIWVLHWSVDTLVLTFLLLIMSTAHWVVSSMRNLTVMDVRTSKVYSNSRSFEYHWQGDLVKLFCCLKMWTTYNFVLNLVLRQRSYAGSSL